MLASLVGFLGDFDLAEEAAQEAFAVAAERWPRDGVPANPGAWLTVTARNRAIDRIRRERTLAEKARQLEVPEATMDELDDTVIEDERLELIFTCCHPALALEAQVALTLRALGGLTTDEIARAFLVSEETMKRRLSRAKAKIKATGIPFAVPAEHLLPDRLDAVLAVVYLIYNEGYSADRIDLAGEAIRLGRVLAALMPDEPEVHGLLALMQIHHARRKARFSGDELVLLEDQDRSLWDAEEIAAGRDRARARDRAARPRAVRAASRDRLAPGRRADRLERDCRAVRPARADHALASGGAEPRGRSRPGRVNRAGARDRRAARARRLPVPALDARRAAAPARPHR